VNLSEIADLGCFYVISIIIERIKYYICICVILGIYCGIILIGAHFKWLNILGLIINHNSSFIIMYPLYRLVSKFFEAPNVIHRVVSLALNIDAVPNVSVRTIISIVILSDHCGLI